MGIAWDDYLVQVQDRGQYTTRREAERATRAVMTALGSHLVGAERRELSDQLPVQFQALLLDPLPATTPLSPPDFVEAVALLSGGATPQTARWDAGAVLSTLADLIDPELLRPILIQLPPGYAPLFGRTEPA
ncbi:DUF2267 domain-containing protein [Streptomyces albidochromogenes]|uniref:DUF2267 domain-containing protein n=1 Tax=Streptomyces albidochromogenes TaxID=329524 RepID=A0ABW6FN90_9ACTN